MHIVSIPFGVGMSGALNERTTLLRKLACPVSETHILTSAHGVGKTNLVSFYLSSLEFKDAWPRKRVYLLDISKETPFNYRWPLVLPLPPPKVSRAERRRNRNRFTDNLEKIVSDCVRTILEKQSTHKTFLEILSRLAYIERYLAKLFNSRLPNFVSVFRVITHYPRRVLSDDELRTKDCPVNGSFARRLIECGRLLKRRSIPSWSFVASIGRRPKQNRFLAWMSKSKPSLLLGCDVCG